MANPLPNKALWGGGEATLAPVASLSIIPQNVPVVGVSTLLNPLLLYTVAVLPPASDKTISYRDL
jgi:hypothetical protein